jgi:glyoxylase-like metal-dependent hydrolase (beta-lactamase superfamily II)
MSVAAFPVEKLPANFKLYRVEVNTFWQTNCYILTGATNKAIIIDPGDELKYIPVEDREIKDRDVYHSTGEHTARIEFILKKYNITPEMIIFSHGHLDHLSSATMLKEKYKCEIVMHAADVHDGYAKDNRLFDVSLPKVDRTVEDGEIIKLDGMELKVIHTPGHSPGGISLFTTFNNQPYLFSGDTLLYHTTGRTNFRDGSGSDKLLYESITKRLFTLPEDTIVFPGHYNYTTIGEEKVSNYVVDSLRKIYAPEE